MSFTKENVNFSQCILIAKGILFLFPALIRSNSAERKAHDPDIILKIEVQHLKNELLAGINPFEINVLFLNPMKT